jgi:xanthine dehydrogenase YagT iron-sulfur-binding subunit
MDESTDDLNAEPGSKSANLTRRGFLQSALAAMAATQAEQAAAAAATPAAKPAAPAIPVKLSINGQDHSLVLEPRVTLLDALRESLGLMGTKKGCDRGQCGACTVLANGRRINSCLSLAVMHEGDQIVTVEGLAYHGELSQLQAAFIEHDAFQCGYCTPGQLCSATALLTEVQAGEASAVSPDVRQAVQAWTDDEIRERMSGNLCRCGAYPNIVAAVRSVALKPA